MGFEMSENNERPPVSDVIEVHNFINIYKTDKWWCSAIDGTMFGKRRVFFYLHRWEKGKWKRKGKMTIGSQKNWDDIKNAGDELVAKVFGGA